MSDDVALVTGAAGFIGSNLSRELVDRGYRVRGLDNFETGRRTNLEELVQDESFELVEGDLRDEAVVRSAMEDVEYVFHQGAVPSVPRSIDDPQLSTEVNCLGTTILLEAARDADVETVVVASSSSVYGSSEELPKHETMPVNPESPYALTKYWTEKLAVQFSDLYGLDTVALRYFNVFGPRQDPSSEYAAVIPKFIRLMRDGERPVIYGDGEQSRDFTYIDNVVEANVLAAESDAAGDVLNVACGDRITINDLVERLNVILGTSLEPRYDDPRPGDVKHSHADISRAREAIGYEPSVPFEGGLRETVSWFADRS